MTMVMVLLPLPVSLLPPLLLVVVWVSCPWSCSWIEFMCPKLIIDVCMLVQWSL